MNAEEALPLNVSSLKDMIYEIRGKKVMFDFDLARIYGYETRTFNQQVKRNLNRFPQDFLFQVTLKEAKTALTSHFVTLEINPRSAHLKHPPYAFTEEGIYMLMTVLKGDLAIAQSIAIIRLFKAMKDYLSFDDGGDYAQGMLRLIRLHDREIQSHDARIGHVETSIDALMKEFGLPRRSNAFLVMDGERIEADEAYQRIYAAAKGSVIVIDDYVSVKTLRHLKSCRPEVSLTLISDNKAAAGVKRSDLDDFAADTGHVIAMKPSFGKVHDRYIVLDYQTGGETIFHCGASSKDAGKKATTIMRIENPKDFHRLIDALIDSLRP